MNDLNYFIGSENICPIPVRTYDEKICAFVGDFSQALLADSQTKGMPDVLSLAFWCRKANIQRQQAKLPSNEFRLGRGVAFHVTPANVPVNFAFSYIFSLLAGNANLVRLPSKPFPQVAAIVRVLKEVISNYQEIAKRTAMFSYVADDEITASFCAQADVRIIWGGDVTVSKIKSMPSKPRCQDICFSDRVSFAVVDGVALTKASETELRSLAHKFYNDTFLMDQNACSSPKIIFWQNSVIHVREKFWAAVEEEAVERYCLQATSAVQKFNQSCLDAVNLAGYLDGIKRSGNIIYRLWLTSLPKESETRLRGSCGYFYECDLVDLGMLKEIVSDKCQTVTYYGLDPKFILDYVIKEGLMGIDRIVPVGSAMDIGLIWDGFDLIRTFSRQIDMVVGC